MKKHVRSLRNNPQQTDVITSNVYVEKKFKQLRVTNPRSPGLMIEKFFVKLTNFFDFNKKCEIPKNLFENIEENKRSILKIQIGRSTAQVVEIV